MSTCNRLDLGTLGSQPVMPKNLPGHWIGVLYNYDWGEPAVSYR